MQIKELLKAFGFQHLATVSNGEEAKIELSKNSYDLILADWHMEPCDGLQLLKYVRENANFKAIAFVLITAESTKERVVDAIRAGVDDYLIKPLTRVQIETKVYSVLLKKRAENP
jgi:two-component system chemotaxis response regulator CheY